MYVRSNWNPPPPPPALDTSTCCPKALLRQIVTYIRQTIQKKRMGKTNLLPYQIRALQLLQRQQDFLICPSDKNLGLAIIEQHD